MRIFPHSRPPHSFLWPLAGAALGACLLLAPSASAQDKTAEPAGPERHYTAQDMFSLVAASDPQISPDGRYIAYVRESNDIMVDRAVHALWLIDVRSGKETPLVTDSDAFAPRWSPDGGRLAYVSTQKGGPQIWVRWMRGGEAVRLTNLPTAPRGLYWSPDGKTIAYTMLVKGKGPDLGQGLTNKPEGAKWAPPLMEYDQLVYRADGAGYLKPGFSKIFVVPATGGAPRQLTFGPYDEDGPLSWTPNGKTIYFSANRRPDWETKPMESDVYALDVKSGAIKQITTRKGPDGRALVSPDGRSIAWLGFDDKGRSYENSQLYVMAIGSAQPRSLTAKWDVSVEDIAWDHDSSGVYAQYTDHGVTKVARISLGGSHSIVATGLSGGTFYRPYSGGSFSVSHDDEIAFSGGTPTRPAEVQIASSGNGRMLTDLNRALREGKDFGPVQKITVASSFDGKTIEGWLTLPPDYQKGKKVPLILEIHGGPFASYGPSFASDNQLYAAAGYAVLSSNPRGSTSYGEAFANAIDKDYPGHDYDDLMSIVDKAIAMGIADPDRLFVTGGSGGGVLTSWIVGKTHRFKAAAAQKPVINWTTQALTSDGPAIFGPYWVGGQPWTNHEAFWAHSPLAYVGNVETPTILVVGSEDYRTPVSESEQFYTALKLRGIPTVLVKVPGVGHGALNSRPSQVAARVSAILTWFKRYEKGWKPGQD